MGLTHLSEYLRYNRDEEDVVRIRGLSGLVARLGMLAVPVSAVGDETVGVVAAAEPGASGNNLDRIGRLEVPGAMAIAFSSTKPHAFVSTRGNEKASLVVIDISKPEMPEIINSIGLPDVGQQDLNASTDLSGQPER